MVRIVVNMNAVFSSCCLFVCCIVCVLLFVCCCLQRVRDERDNLSQQVPGTPVSGACKLSLFTQRK